MIHALPGMGADHRIFPDPWSTLPDFVSHDWGPHSGEQTLSDVARSMCEHCQIKEGDDLVGVSLGGMVACEITKIRKISRLYLVGSAIKKEEISKLLAAMHPLAKVAPFDWIRLSANSIPTDLAQMLAGADSSFIRTMCAAIFQWEGLGQPKTQVFRIHGRHDLIIPPPKAVDLLLDGGHLISLTHAAECVDFIRANNRL